MNAHALASAESLDAVIAALPAGLPTAERDLLERFTRSFFERLPQDELEGRDWKKEREKRERDEHPQSPVRRRPLAFDDRRVRARAA